MSKARDKGSAFEREVVEFLKPWFPACERRVMGGSNDRGDVGGIPNVVLEVKAERGMKLSAALTEAEKEANNANAFFYAAILKRRQKPVSQSYAVMPLTLYTILLDVANISGYLEDIRADEVQRQEVHGEEGGEARPGQGHAARPKR